LETTRKNGEFQEVHEIKPKYLQASRIRDLTRENFFFDRTIKSMEGGGKRLGGFGLHLTPILKHAPVDQIDVFQPK